MRFGYYRDLPASQRRIYDKSDAIGAITLPRLGEHRRRADELRAALGSQDKRRVNAHAQALVDGMTKALRAPRVEVRVLSRRPKNHGGELHGLYTLEVDGRAHIELWMRTAAHVRVVAYRTFLRTLAHELCHHLDLTLYRLGETFHTEGFFRRESSLVRQLLDAREKTSVTAPPARDRPRRPEPAAGDKTKRPRSGRSRRPARPLQLSLFS